MQLSCLLLRGAESINVYVYNVHFFDFFKICDRLSHVIVWVNCVYMFMLFILSIIVTNP